MKYITVILMSVLSSILCSISLFAQTGSGSAGQFDGYDFSTFTINGLEMAGPEYTEQDIIRAGPEYTEQDIIRAFGQPDSVELGEFGYIFLIGKDFENCRYSIRIRWQIYCKWIHSRRGPHQHTVS